MSVRMAGSARQRIRTAFLAAILAPCLLRAQAGPGAGNSARKHCLWQVRGEACTVYLQGSLHFLKRENYPLAEPIEKAFADSDVLVLEVDLAEMSDLAAQFRMAARGMLPAGESLEGALTPETYALAARCVEAIGLPMASFQRFKPWFFAMTLAANRLQALGFSPLEGLDWHFYWRAKARQMPIVGLETAELQLRLFDNLSAADQDTLVRKTIEDLHLVETDMGTIITAWETGDSARMEETLLKTFADHPAIYGAFIADRNANWMTRIKEFLAGNRNVMVVVGAGHMVGDGGLVALLRKAGYHPEQL